MIHCLTKDSYLCGGHFVKQLATRQGSYRAGCFHANLACSRPAFRYDRQIIGGLDAGLNTAYTCICSISLAELLANLWSWSEMNTYARLPVGTRQIRQ